MTSGSPRTDDALVRRLAVATGLSCTLIGAAHIALGADIVPGAAAASASVDSQERFYGAVFAHYGLTWLRASRTEDVTAPSVAELALVMAAGGIGRLASRARRGKPHWFQDALTAVEFVLPATVWALHRRQHRVG